MATVGAGTVAAWDCDTVRAAFFDRRLPANTTWPQPNATQAQKVAALRAVVGGVGGDSNASNPVAALANVVGFSAAANIAATIEAGATGPVALALYRRVTSNTQHGAGDCHQSPAEIVTSPITEAWSGAVAAAGKIALTLLLVALGGGMVLLGLRQLAAKRLE